MQILEGLPHSLKKQILNPKFLPLFFHQLYPGLLPDRYGSWVQNQIPVSYRKWTRLHFHSRLFLSESYYETDSGMPKNESEIYFRYPPVRLPSFLDLHLFSSYG